VPARSPASRISGPPGNPARRILAVQLETGEEGAMSTEAPPAAAEPPPISPCLGICLMDPATRICRGCRRTIAEIATWHDASPAEKRAILARLAARGRTAEGGRG
jgi:predicted Fe-S protein YdhL (DUF1289 family)